MTRAQLILAGLLIIVGMGALYQHRQTMLLRDELVRLQADRWEMDQMRLGNGRLSMIAEETAALRRDNARLPQLRSEVLDLRRRFALSTSKNVVKPASAPGGRTTGGLGNSQLDERPRVLQQAVPIYPLGMRMDEAPGDVTVAFIVDESGSVSDATVEKSTDEDFNGAAIEAVNRWKFEPGKKGGKPVRTRMRVPVFFRISSDKTGGP
ncbi:MAG: energy transducer TonB [Opitutaceae bacterium]